ncbi:hypothetical protein [Polynucleobacter sp. UK-Kesae-W10]|uniref:hypothetical protein n=1 Tax=Polynucleobacter sp. UK-Kesae-W10 TaxID=1819738 RepID=UPI001C0CE002|nr:hypothetical protein [Polynucleobacter sp. UK-Kesae-W10]MBU3577508.1 hypothetical protein [Polynucleobacter sp. UK-Kesae-W10]
MFRSRRYALNWGDEASKGVHVPSLRGLNEAESLVLLQAGYNPEKFRRVLAFNDKPTPISQCQFGEMCVQCNQPSKKETQ